MESESASYPVLGADDAVREAERCLESEPPARARRALRKLREKFPWEARLWQLDGLLAESLGHAAEAASSYREASRLDPSAIGYELDLTEALIADGRLEEAETIARSVSERLVSERPVHPTAGKVPSEKSAERASQRARALGLLGLARARSGRLADAERDFREALRAEPSFAWAARELSDVLAETGRIEEAHEMVVRLLDVDPLDPRNHGYLGEVLERKGLLAESLTAFRTALWLQPDYTWAARKLGFLLWKKGRTKEARRVLRGALRHAPHDPTLLSGLAQVEWKLGNVERAERCYRRALRIDGQISAAFGGLLEILMLDDRWGEARELLGDRVRRVRPSARALRRQGRDARTP